MKKKRKIFATVKTRPGRYRMQVFKIFPCTLIIDAGSRASSSITNWNLIRNIRTSCREGLKTRNKTKGKGKEIYLYISQETR